MLLSTHARFKVVLHAAAATRRVLIQTGSARDNGLVPIAVHPGVPVEGFHPARRKDGVGVGIASGSISVVAQADGTVLVHDSSLELPPVRANDLVDEGDRGDLYHCDPIGEPIRARSSTASVVESGPLRARLRIAQQLTVPKSLAADRQRRHEETRELIAVTEVTLTAGERRVDFATSLVNHMDDHRLRALVHFPRHAEQLDVEHGLAVVGRPFDTARALGAEVERAAPTGNIISSSISPTARRVALMSRGLPEHEAIRDRDETRLALTLLRSVGWLSRGDLSVIDHAAGPMLQTPNAQERGSHHFEYAILLHAGDWRTGEVLAEARRYASPGGGGGAKAVCRCRRLLRWSQSPRRRRW